MVLILFTSCDKEEPRPNYYYKFKINGVEKEFKGSKDANIVFIEDSETSNRYTIFTFVTGNDPTKNALVISLRTNVTPEYGIRYTMQHPIFINEVVAPSLSFVYFDENGKEFGATRLQSTNPGAADDGSLMLAELFAEGSTGMFEATMFDLSYEGELSQRVPMYLTDGEFFMPNMVSLR